jgi:hypothetical protein
LGLTAQKIKVETTYSGSWDYYAEKMKMKSGKNKQYDNTSQTEREERWEGTNKPELVMQY